MTAEQAIYDVLSKLEKKAANLKPILEQISNIVRNAIRNNLAAGGRTDGSTSNVTIFSGGNQRWVPLAPNTVKAYRKKGYTLEPTLRRKQGGLQSTVGVAPFGGSAIKATANSPYAAIHQYGGIVHNPGGTAYIVTDNGLAVFISNRKAAELESKGITIKRTRPHLIRIPARPWLTLTPKDVQEIVDEIAKYIY